MVFLLSESCATFDVRQGVCPRTLTSPIAQRVYDCMNRTVFIAGDIHFGELFIMPVSQLAQHAASRVAASLWTSRFGQPAKLLNAIDDASRILGGRTLASICTTVGTPSDTASPIVGRLRTLGIPLVAPATTSELARARAEALEYFLAEAGGLRFVDLFALTRRELHPRAANALAVARRTGLEPVS